jgi:hypothetical protein
MSSTSDEQKTLVPVNDTSLPRRSVEVTRTCVRRGQGVTRALWVNISPRNPILKDVAAVPAAAVMLSMMILMMVIAGFALLAMALMLAKSGRTNKVNNR